jgi:hypothetical protein
VFRISGGFRPQSRRNATATCASICTVSVQYLHKTRSMVKLQNHPRARAGITMLDDAIVYGPDGPEGTEAIRFAPLGIRFALMAADGTLTDHGRYDLEMLGGTLPSVGDTFSMLWPAGDPGRNETYEVVARYYVGEFAGDNSWWLLIKERKPNKQDLAIYRVARAASRETRRIRKAREALAEKRLIHAASERNKKPRPTGRGKTR